MKIERWIMASSFSSKQKKRPTFFPLLLTCPKTIRTTSFVTYNILIGPSLLWPRNLCIWSLPNAISLRWEIVLLVSNGQVQSLTSQESLRHSRVLGIR
jgi:hypothetical protein